MSAPDTTNIENKETAMAALLGVNGAIIFASSSSAISRFILIG